MADRQCVSEHGDGGVVIGQLLVDRDRLTDLGLRLRRPARTHQYAAEVAVAVRQGVAKLGEGGVVVGQRTLDHDRLADLGLRLYQPTHVAQQVAEAAVAYRARLPRNKETAG